MDVLDEQPPRLAPELVREVLETHWGLESADVAPLSSERDLNVLVSEEAR